MKQRITKTATGKRLQSRLTRIKPKSQRGLTESQIRYRKDKKRRDDYWKGENGSRYKYKGA